MNKVWTAFICLAFAVCFTPAAAVAGDTLVMATTTSTDNTCLLYTSDAADDNRLV